MYIFRIIFFCAFYVCAAVWSFDRDVPALIWGNTYDKFNEIKTQQYYVPFWLISAG